MEAIWLKSMVIQQVFRAGLVNVVGLHVSHSWAHRFCKCSKPTLQPSSWAHESLRKKSYFTRQTILQIPLEISHTRPLGCRKRQNIGPCYFQTTKKNGLWQQQLEILFPQRLHVNTVLIIYMVEKQSMNKKKKKKNLAISYLYSNCILFDPSILL